MRKYFILDGDNAVHETEDVLAWAKWFEKDCRKVARTKIGASTVSTVFLGLDHNFSGEGRPVLWETMVFGGKLNRNQDRCAGTWADAHAMHDKMVRKVREAKND
jgi:hypothetical protein